jgi:hypothetical protein
MRRPPPLLELLPLLPLLLIGCQRTEVVVSDEQRSACRRAAESAPSPEQALQRNAAEAYSRCDRHVLEGTSGP